MISATYPIVYQPQLVDYHKLSKILQDENPKLKNQLKKIKHPLETPKY